MSFVLRVTSSCVSVGVELIANWRLPTVDCRFVGCGLLIVDCRLIYFAPQVGLEPTTL